MKVLHIIPNLNFSNAAKQLSLLAPALTASGIECRVAVMSGIGPFARRLQIESIAPDFMSWNRLIDPQPFFRLKHLIRSFSPDVIHCWGKGPVLALAVIGGMNSNAAMIGSCMGMPWEGVLGKLGSRLISRLDRLVLQWPFELVHWSSSVPQEKLCTISPSVEPIDPSSMPRILDSAPIIPEKARVILCVGPLEPSKGIKEAIWAFHILGCLFPDLHLMVIGEGTDRARLDRLSQNIFPQRVVFVGVCLDEKDYMARAEVTWVPSLEPRGFNVALEAIAAEKPVVASRLPGLTDILGDEEAGILVAPGDKVDLARKTRLLLEDPKRRAQLGEAGRRRAREHFSVQSMVRAYQSLYESAAKFS